MSDSSLSPRTWVALVAIIVGCLAMLIHMGNPEPALPTCNPSATYHVRCQP